MVVTSQDFINAAQRMFKDVKSSQSGNLVEVNNHRVAMSLTIHDISYNVEITAQDDPLDSEKFVTDDIPDAVSEFLGHDISILASNSPESTALKLRTVASMTIGGTDPASIVRKLRRISASCGLSFQSFKVMENFLLRLSKDNRNDKMNDLLKRMRKLGWNVKGGVKDVDGDPSIGISLGDEYDLTASIAEFKYVYNFSVIGRPSTKASGITKDPVGAMERWKNSKVVKEALAVDVNVDVDDKKTVFPGNRTVPSPPPEF